MARINRAIELSEKRIIVNAAERDELTGAYNKHILAIISKIILSLINLLNFNNKYNSINTLVVNNLSSKEITLFKKFIK